MQKIAILELSKPYLDAIRIACLIAGKATENIPEVHQMYFQIYVTVCAAITELEVSELENLMEKPSGEDPGAVN
jgi:hypothetical protein